MPGSVHVMELCKQLLCFECIVGWRQAMLIKRIEIEQHRNPEGCRRLLAIVVGSC
jgi:hypothetical protein